MAMKLMKIIDFLEEVVLNSISPALLRNQFRLHDSNRTIMDNRKRGKEYPHYIIAAFIFTQLIKKMVQYYIISGKGNYLRPIKIKVGMFPYLA